MFTSPVVMGRPREQPSVRRSRRLATTLLVAGVATSWLTLDSNVVLFAGANLRSLMSSRPQEVRTAVHASEQGGSDPVNNVSPETRQAGMRYAQKFEDLFMAGKVLYDNLKKQNPESPKRLFFVGTNGNSGEEVAESLMDGLGYVPADDGTWFIRRTPDMNLPPIKYTLWRTDKMVAEKSKISPTDLFIEDEEKYRDFETEVLKEFVSKPYNGYPMGCIVGEGAVLREENKELLKSGLVIWLDVDTQHSWQQTQSRPQTGGGLYIPKEFLERPPVWAIANGWDGDIDDSEGYMAYKEIVQSRRVHYETVSDLRLRTDVAGIAENSYWGAERLIKAVNQHYGFKKDEVSVEQEVMESDMEKFLEGARLSKYTQPALKWCKDQGATSIEDIVENLDSFCEALELKPLERKRLEKASAAVVT